ncbi:MAG: hypothetical protein ACRC6X_03780 [Culicoidibacterales bacterium]
MISGDGNRVGEQQHFFLIMPLIFLYGFKWGEWLLIIIFFVVGVLEKVYLTTDFFMYLSVGWTLFCYRPFLLNENLWQVSKRLFLYLVWERQKYE